MFTISPVPSRNGGKFCRCARHGCSLTVRILGAGWQHQSFPDSIGAPTFVIEQETESVYRFRVVGYNGIMLSLSHTGDETVRRKKIFLLLQEHYPEAKTGLNYQNPFQLLVAALLSARTTDMQVNRVTAKLFAHAGTPQALAGMEPEELEPLLQGCGIYRQKSRYLVQLSRFLLERHGGIVPRCRAELLALPGVGRKTANVVLSGAYGIPALAVDTHVFRVSRRLGLVTGNRVEEVERELTGSLSPKEWAPLHHRLIAHGRAYCKARHPLCNECFLSHLCLHDRSNPSQTG